LRGAAASAVLFAFVVAGAHSLTIALAVGAAGMSRAVSVGLDTLLRDHAVGLLAAGAAAFVGAVVSVRLVRRLASELRGAFVGLVAAELVLALAAIAAVGELTLVDLSVVFLAVTGLGGVFVGGIAGGLVGRARPTGRTY
jgi:hypothetical protein